MKLISCHSGQLQELAGEELTCFEGKGFSTGLPAWDALLPRKTFSFGQVHELLSRPEHPQPLFVAGWLARMAAARGAVVWCDPDQTLYPPALLRLGLNLERVYLLRPSFKDLTWAAAQALGCRGVAATVAPFNHLSRIEARRQQLAAERGGGIGIFLRSFVPSMEYAAATRWLVEPLPGDVLVQRWSLQLVHGHGGQVGHSIILEAGREADSVCAFEAVEHRTVSTQIAV